jgi:hypothetical protein
VKAAIYARVSTFDQEPENQLAELRRYVEAWGWASTEFVDRGVSGAKDRRPALDALVANAKRRRFDVLVCWRLDRLGRSLKHLIGLLDDLQALGVAFVSLAEGIDATTPAGKLQMHILGAIAEFERERIRERVLAGLAAHIWTPPRCRAIGRNSIPNRIGCGRISGLSVEVPILRAKMDIRAPRANRGAGLLGQGCYRPDAVSARPMGHLSRRSLSISSRKSSAIHSRRLSPGGQFMRFVMPLPDVRVAAQTPHRESRQPRRSARVCWRRRSSLCCDLVASAP